MCRHSLLVIITCYIICSYVISLQRPMWPKAYGYWLSCWLQRPTDSRCVYCPAADSNLVPIQEVADTSIPCDSSRPRFSQPRHYICTTYCWNTKRQERSCGLCQDCKQVAACTGYLSSMHQAVQIMHALFSVHVGGPAHNMQYKLCSTAEVLCSQQYFCC